ncbi:MAG: hypothetical protein WBW78_21080, partial [Terrimicrobiaceae bacterium]
SPQHSINEFGRAKHGDGLFFGQSQGAHPVNQDTLDGSSCFHFRGKVSMTISRFIEEHISALNEGMAPNSGQSISIAA